MMLEKAFAACLALLVFVVGCSRKIEPVPDRLGAFVETKQGLVEIQPNVNLRSAYERFEVVEGMNAFKFEPENIKSFLLYFKEPAPYDRLFTFGWSTPMTIKILESHGLDKVKTVELNRQERRTEEGVLVKLTPKEPLPLGFNYLTFVEENDPRQLLDGFVFDVVPTGYALDQKKIQILYSEFYKNLFNPDMDVETVLNFVTPEERDTARKILEGNATYLRNLDLKNVDEVALRILKRPDGSDLGALIVAVTYDDRRFDQVHVDTLKCPVHRVGEIWYLFEFHQEPKYHF